MKEKQGEGLGFRRESRKFTGRRESKHVIKKFLPGCLETARHRGEPNQTASPDFPAGHSQLRPEDTEARLPTFKQDFHLNSFRQVRGGAGQRVILSLSFLKKNSWKSIFPPKYIWGDKTLVPLSLKMQISRLSVFWKTPPTSRELRCSQWRPLGTHYAGTP